MRNTMQRGLRFLVTGLAALTASMSVMAEPGDGMFWSIEGPQGRVGYLLGTIHSEDPRVLEFPPAILEALDESSVFAMELVPDLPTLATLLQIMNYQDGTTLASVVGQERFDTLVELLAEYGIPASQLASMKPWAATLTLSVPPPESGLFMDFSLSLRAAGDGKRVISLETLDEQLSFLENMPLDKQLKMLDQAIAEFDRALDVYHEMLDIYLSGDLDALLAQARNEMATLDDETRDYFVTEGLTNRNIRMARVIDARLDEAGEQGLLFATAGALHLPMDQGLVELLRDEGWTLTPLPNPFAGASSADD